jgi:hypothetical protein
MVAVAEPVAALGTTGADPMAMFPGCREMVTVPSGGTCTHQGNRNVQISKWAAAGGMTHHRAGPGSAAGALV